MFDSYMNDKRQTLDIQSIFAILYKHMSLPPPTASDVHVRCSQMDELKSFFNTAVQSRIPTHYLPTGEKISCVHWCGKHYITGTDILRSLIFKFYCFGRIIHNHKKFKEVLFSDLRIYKDGIDAQMETKGDFLSYLHKEKCILTKKRQKVFFWNSVSIDWLFYTALI